ncbi:MAG: CPXCG motif-containing cysteine-rich protein [Gammaproteobacteria bacterium]|nr:CPXCG motif-containing cysteine-rich protein [Gammaproteobacteria bacterium]
MLEEFSLQCPNCGEIVNIFVDSSVEQQIYVEDCSVCCRPMLLAVSYDEQSGISVTANREDD